MSLPYPTDGDNGVSLRQKRNRRQAIQDPQVVGNSLRDNRPQLPPPQPSQGSAISGISQISQSRVSTESNRSGDVRPKPRPKRNDETSNLVKKRYSVRYGQAPDISQGAPSVPGIPRLPQNFAQQNGSNASLAQQNQGVDMRALRDPNLKPDQCTFMGASTLRNR